MDDAERREQIRRYWEYIGNDEDVSHEIFHDDAVLEFPQSGERFEGVANFKEWRRVPGHKVAREKIYVTEPWDAPEWRAPWRAAP